MFNFTPKGCFDAAGKNLRTLIFCTGPLIPLFWTSGGVSLGFLRYMSVGVYISQLQKIFAFVHFLVEETVFVESGSPDFSLAK